MTHTPEDETARPARYRRRRLLQAGAVLALGAGGAVGYRQFVDEDEPHVTADPYETIEGIPEDDLLDLVHRYAPDLYFDRREKWFPTDVLAYSSEIDGELVVDGFHALIEYTREFTDPATPPRPTVYYHVTSATDDIFAIQYWMYEVFDQFTVNFHWHDWELLQIFIDIETREPVLLAASAHSRASPNNEFLEPDLEDGQRPIVLAELGSHSSATDVNEHVPSFERFPDDGIHSDVTNDWTTITDRIESPFVYGLPRDEGARLPFVLPELDDVPLYEHPDLAEHIDIEDFIDQDVTIREWRDLLRPPSKLPLREDGLVMTHPDSRVSGDVRYTLEPMANVTDIVAFTGPQLSFEFAIPGFLEDVYADHITSVGIPWEQPRYTDPVHDISDPRHRAAIDGSEPIGLLNRVVGRFMLLDAGSAGVVDMMTDAERAAYPGLAHVSLYTLPVELAVRLASRDPVMVASNAGMFGFLHRRNRLFVRKMAHKINDLSLFVFGKAFDFLDDFCCVHGN